jgi:ABC-type nitrate/sulfonate/bicarbonate transport system permease component
MFASKRGLGYLIMNSIGSGDVIVTMAVAVFLFTLAGAANALLLHLDRRFLKYA